MLCATPALAVYSRTFARDGGWEKLLTEVRSRFARGSTQFVEFCFIEVRGPRLWPSFRMQHRQPSAMEAFEQSVLIKKWDLIADMCVWLRVSDR